MPLTPFHFGPILLFGYLLRRRMDLVTFLIASVILDVRASLVFFGILPGPNHGLFHNTYLGALVVALGFAGCVLLFFRQFPSIAQKLSTRPESVKYITIASVAGTWSHVTLDAFTHSEMQPFYPLAGNPLYHLISPFLVYGLCMLAFLVFAGIAVVLIIQDIRKNGVTHNGSPKRMQKISLVLGVVIGIVVGMLAIIGVTSILNELLGISTFDVTIERINSTHAAVSWTTEQPTHGYIKTYVSHQCGPAFGKRVTINIINDSSFTRTHLIVAPIYDMKANINVTDIPGTGSLKSYRVEAVSAGEIEKVGVSILHRNLSQMCQ